MTSILGGKSILNKILIILENLADVGGVDFWKDLRKDNWSISILLLLLSYTESLR